ncbi:hypothetical protein EV122DRAFT_276014 [Schizophyllum commune]
MSSPVKSILPVPLPFSLLAGARAPIPQLQTSFPELGTVRPPVSDTFVSSAVPSVDVGGGELGVLAPAEEGVATVDSSLSVPDSALRAAFDRADRTLSGVRSLLSSREADLQRSQEESAFRFRLLGEQLLAVEGLKVELSDAARENGDLRSRLSAAIGEVGELRAQLESRRSQAALRFRFLQGRLSRAQDDSAGLRVALAGQQDDVRFLREACRAAEADARAAHRELANVREDSAHTLQCLRTSWSELLAAYRSRVPWGVYQRVLDQLHSYAAHYGSVPDLPLDGGDPWDDVRAGGEPMADIRLDAGGSVGAGDAVGEGGTVGGGEVVGEGEASVSVGVFEGEEVVMEDGLDDVDA